MEISELKKKALEILEELWETDYILLNPSFIHRLNHLVTLTFKYSIDISDEIEDDIVSIISTILILKSSIFDYEAPTEDEYDGIILEGVYVIGKSSFEQIERFLAEKLSLNLISHVENQRELAIAVSRQIKRRRQLLDYLAEIDSDLPFFSLLRDSLINLPEEKVRICVRKDFSLRTTLHQIGLICLNLKEGKKIWRMKNLSSSTSGLSMSKFLRTVSAVKANTTTLDSYYSQFKDFLQYETASQLELAYKIYQAKKEKKPVDSLIKIYEERYSIQPRRKDCLKVIKYWNRQYYLYLKLILNSKKEEKNHMEMIKNLNKFFTVYDLS